MNCSNCQDTGWAQAAECTCRAGRRLKIKRLYPWMDESQVNMRLEMQEADQRLWEAWNSIPYEDRERLDHQPEPGD